MLIQRSKVRQSGRAEREPAAGLAPGIEKRCQKMSVDLLLNSVKHGRTFRRLPLPGWQAHFERGQYVTGQTQWLCPFLNLRGQLQGGHDCPMSPRLGPPARPRPRSLFPQERAGITSREALQPRGLCTHHRSPSGCNLEASCSQLALPPWASAHPQAEWQWPRNSVKGAGASFLHTYYAPVRSP